MVTAIHQAPGQATTLAWHRVLLRQCTGDFAKLDPKKSIRLCRYLKTIKQYTASSTP
jgi:hypothetical protein